MQCLMFYFSLFCMIQTQIVQQTTKLRSYTGKIAASMRKRWRQLCKPVGMMTTNRRIVSNSCTELNRTLMSVLFSACHYLKIISSCDACWKHVALSKRLLCVHLHSSCAHVTCLRKTDYENLFVVVQLMCCCVPLIVVR